jgi:hypothetical protein
MDNFLKHIVHSDEGNQAQHTDTKPIPQPLPVDHEQPPQERGILDKLSNSFAGDKHVAEHAAAPAANTVSRPADDTTTSGHHGGILGGIAHALSGDSSEKPPLVVAKPQDDTTTHHASGGESLFDKIHGTFSPKPATQSPPPPPPKEPTLGERIHNVFSSSDTDTSKVAEHQSPPLPPHKESLVDKVTDTFGGGQYGTTTAHGDTKAAVAGQESIGDKISSLLGVYHDTPPPAPPKEEGLMDKIGGVFKGDHHAPPPDNQHDLSAKFDKLMGRDEEPPKPQTLGDKISGVFGGGAKGEKKEDPLDKAVDMFQEHVLKQGDQKNESALEQFKDEQITDGIRRTYKNVTGHEFFVRDKE